MSQINDINIQTQIAVQRELRRRQQKRIDYLLTLSDQELYQLADSDETAEKVLCERSFHAFVNRAWSQIDPAEFVDEWFIKFMCDAFQASYEGYISSYNLLRRFNMNVPPGMSKSMLSCVFFPVWLWIKICSLGIMTGSYALDNAQRDSVKSRDLLETEWFKSKWGSNFTMSSDQNQKQFYKNDKMGYRQAFSLMSRNVTGKRGDFVIIDDALGVKDAFSKAHRESVKNTLNQVMLTRLNDPKKSVVINLGQRVHADDPSGIFIKSGWTSLILPMEFEKANKCVLPFGEDIRTEEGEILTKRYDRETLEDLKKSLGSYGTAGQLQQRPASLEGGLIKLDDLNYYRELPVVKKYTWSWDLAIKDNERNDYSVGQLWAECENGFYLVYMLREKMTYPTLRAQVKMLYEQYKSAEILVEDKSSGEPLIQEFKKSTNLPILSIIPGREIPKTKEGRVVMASPTFEAGKIFLPESAKWLLDLVEEWTTFPKAPHDDTVDAMTQYICKQRAQGGRAFSVSVIR